MTNAAGDHLIDVWRASLLRQLAHDARTPLNGVLGLAELVSLTADGDVQRYGKLIHQSGARLQRLLDAVLELAQASAATLPDLRPCDPKHFVECVADCHRDAAQRRGAEIAVECDPALPQQLLTDRPRLAFVLHSVIRHLTVHAEPGSVVRLRVQRSGDGILFVASSGGAAVTDGLTREWEAPSARLLKQIGGRFESCAAPGRGYEAWVPFHSAAGGTPRDVAGDTP